MDFFRCSGTTPPLRAVVVGISLMLGVASLCSCQESPRDVKEETPARPDASTPTSTQSKRAAAAPLTHRPSPKPREASDAGWTRLHPAVTASLLSGASPFVDGSVVVSTRDGEVFRVSREGLWEELKLGAPSRGILDVAAGVTPQGSGIAILEVNGQVRWSEDAGKSWRILRKPPPGGPPLFDSVINALSSPVQELSLRRVGGAWVILAVGGTTRVLLSGLGHYFTLPQ